MVQRIAGLAVDVSPPEKPKFKSPLILIHGLWSGSWCWNLWATHFSNLGWECWAINLKGRADRQGRAAVAGLTFADCLEDLKGVIRAAPSPPVLLAHGFGGLLAQKACEEEKAAALILLSSLPPIEGKDARQRELRLLRLKYFPLIFFRRSFCLQERDFRAHWLASVPKDERADIVRRMVPESGHLVNEFFHRSVIVDPERIRCPILAISGADDRVASPASLRETARQLGADIREYPGHGHWIMGENGGEEIVREIHRWLVKELGEEILLAEFSQRQ